MLEEQTELIFDLDDDLRNNEEILVPAGSIGSKVGRVLCTLFAETAVAAAAQFCITTIIKKHLARNLANSFCGLVFCFHDVGKRMRLNDTFRVRLQVSFPRLPRDKMME